MNNNKKRRGESIACREKKSHQSAECSIQMWNVFVPSSKYARPCHGHLAGGCASQNVAYLAFCGTFCSVIELELSLNTNI